MLTFKPIESNEVGLYPATPCLGGDPECFIVDSSGYLIVPPAEPINYDGYGSVGPDGAQLEMRVAPSSCRGYFVDHTRYCLSRATHIAAQLGGQLLFQPALQIGATHRRKLPARANFFGCDEDWCAYSGDRSTRTMDASHHPWRYAGGHIHLGSPPPVPGNSNNRVAALAQKYAPSIIQLMDILVGLFSVAISPEPTLAGQRRKYVGRAGCFRIQPHGYEYRVPDCSFWRHPKLVYVLCSLARTTHKMYVRYPEIATAITGATKTGVVPEVIQSADPESASRLWTDLVNEFVVPASKAHKFDGASDDIVFGATLLQVARNLVSSMEGHGLAKEWSLLGQAGETFSTVSGHGAFCGGGVESLCHSLKA